MTPKELQKLLESARSIYTPGVPMDASIDQDILVGLIDGLGNGDVQPQDRDAYADGVRIGNALMQVLKATK